MKVKLLSKWLLNILFVFFVCNLSFNLEKAIANILLEFSYPENISVRTAQNRPRSATLYKGENQSLFLFPIQIVNKGTEPYSGRISIEVYLTKQVNGISIEEYLGSYSRDVRLLNPYRSPSNNFLYIGEIGIRDFILPETLPSGEYFIKLILEYRKEDGTYAASDTELLNDQDQKVQVAPIPNDVNIFISQVTPLRINPGQPLDINGEVCNSGDSSSGMLRVNFYLGQARGGTDILIKEVRLRSLSPNSSRSFNIQIDSFPALPPGDYWLTSEVQAEIERSSNTNNNIYTYRYQIHVNAQSGLPFPDLKVTSIELYSIKAYETNDKILVSKSYSSIAFSFTIKNDGGVAALPPFKIKAYLSRSPQSKDYLIKEFTYNEILDAGQSVPLETFYKLSDRIYIPSSIKNQIPDGEYWLTVIVDSDGDITEFNENNNSLSAPKKIAFTSSIYDARVEEVTFSPGVIAQGRSFNATCKIRNAGGFPYSLDPRFHVASFYLSLSPGRKDYFLTKISCDRPEYVLPHQTVDYTCSLELSNMNVPQGRYFVTCEVEDDESPIGNIHDSVRQIILTSPPDLVVNSVSIINPPTSVCYGDFIKVSFQIQNLGGLSTGDTTVKTKIFAHPKSGRGEDVLFKEYEIPINLRSHETTSRLLRVPVKRITSRIPGLGQDFYIKVVVNDDQKIFENNKNNNSALSSSYIKYFCGRRETKEFIKKHETIKQHTPQMQRLKKINKFLK
ncbi:MAG: hypothetical protein OD816_001222 [Thermodesulfobacterium sp.]|uniref:CARDB domain-containing protein n=1 Tax=Candidatus Thermodesulfobacterium syntrophicum TaxID=3060442 RepID=A0AAE3P117_9BACT|nr:hypothetical protein [Candidatus Thermodesulfobacterium syntrophicum]